MKRRRSIHFHLTRDDTAIWVESKHPRKGKGAGGGQFTSGAGGGGGEINVGRGGKAVGFEGSGPPPGKPHETPERAGVNKGGKVQPGGWWGRETTGVGEGGETDWRVESGKPEHLPQHPEFKAKPHHPGGSVWGESGRPPFDEHEMASLPAKATQPEHLNTWEKLKAEAEEGHKHFSEVLQKVAKRLGHKVELTRPPEGLSPEEVHGPHGHVFIAPLKRESRSREKVQADYKGDWTHLKDIIRGSIAVSHISELRDVIKAVEAEGLKLAMRPKDKFSEPTPEGYRDLNTVVKLPNNMLAELQYNLKPIVHAKAEAHGPYEKIQKLQRLHGSSEPSPQWPLRHVQQLMKHRETSRSIYDPLWEKATSPKKD